MVMKCNTVDLICEENIWLWWTNIPYLEVFDMEETQNHFNEKTIDISEWKSSCKFYHISF
jgi:hypothetical protein